MNLIQIGPGEKELLRVFVEKLSRSSNAFRYFSSRPLDTIQNHVLTLGYMMEGEIIAYGHLDKDGPNIWLGLAVLSEFRKKGLGKSMLQELLRQGRSMSLGTIKLSVDKDNLAAYALYVNNGFGLLDEKPAYYIMSIDL